MFRLLALCLIGAVLARQPAAPQHSPDHLPDTQFSCRDKVLGGYYADPDAQCQMFHVCVKVAGVGIQDFRFLCPNGTAFDQEAQICAGWADVACEPAALYYSSDNFDLYRIGSGFESKKAPQTFEDEPDFHLQRAEPDILSGAHSSNFFNNREGRDQDDASAKSKNQYDQPQRKKIVKKVQRRPETTQRPQPTPAPQRPQPTPAPQRPQSTPAPQRQFTNNFAGSYNPTSARPSPTTAAPKPQNYNQNQRISNYQPYRQSTTTAAPVEVDYYKSTQDYSQKFEQTTAQNKFNRNFRNRQPSTPEYNYSEQTKKQTYDNVNYDTPSTYAQSSTQRYNFAKDRKQENPTTKVEAKQTSPQFNQQFSDYNQYTTPKNNFNNQAKINSKATQSTPQYNQQYNQQFTGNYSPDQDYEKTKPTTKYAEKKQQFTQKQSTQQYYDQQYNQQTPTPKYNTNLQYDNNQQSTPFYNVNEYKSRAPVSSTPNYEQFSSTQNNRQNYQQYSTAQQFSSSDYNQNYEQKSTANLQQYSTGRPSTGDVNYERKPEAKSTPAPFRSTTTEDYDDGQYRPEIYEREAGGEYDVTARHNFRQDQPAPRAQEPELLKAAHSINIAASGNQLSRDKPSSTLPPYTQPPKATPARTAYTTPSPKSPYSSLAVVTSAAPRPFSARPSPTPTAAPVKKPAPPKQAPLKQAPVQNKPNPAKPNSDGKSKDVSYDYAYYDNSDHYNEYENIEEFGRTSKKQ